MNAESDERRRKVREAREGFLPLCASSRLADSATCFLVCHRVLVRVCTAPSAWAPFHSRGSDGTRKRLPSRHVNLLSDVLLRSRAFKMR